MVPSVHRFKVQDVFALLVILAVFVAACATHAVSAGATTSKRPEMGRYVVILKDSVEQPGNLARAQTRQRDGKLGFVYRHAFKGYSAVLPREEVAALRSDPRVELVAPDREVEAFAQQVPTGIERIFATSNDLLSIDGVDDRRVDADIAIIDTGVDHEHPDLDVVARTDCSLGTEEEASCIDGSGTDVSSHGTHVAGTAAAIDNDEGVVGVAPGARIWAVKVLDGGVNYDSEVAAGVDWVTARANQIEVANMSLGCACELPATAKAIDGSTAAGVVIVVGAGNSSANAAGFAPANHPDVITVSAMADFDGLPGGEAGSSECREFYEGVYGPHEDDSFAAFSNWGEEIEVTAPGVCILSTTKGGGYGELAWWGTSMASPHVAGAAAILAAKQKPENRKEVEAVREAIVEAGNLDWEDIADGFHEPLLDVGDEAVFDPVAPLVVDSDVDRDGRADLVTIRHGVAYVFRGTAQGIAADDPAQPLGPYWESHLPIDVADVSGDRRADLVTFDERTGTISVHLGTANGKISTIGGFTQVDLPGLHSAHGIEPIAAADVNGDGFADLVAFVGAEGGYLATFLRESGAKLAEEPEASLQGEVDSARRDGEGHYFLDAIDVDQDGRADLISIADGEVMVFAGKEDGGFEAPEAVAELDPVFDDGGGLEPVGLGDVDGDGSVDLLALDGTELVLYPDVGSGEAEPQNAYANQIRSSLLGGEGLDLVGLFDYDGDGRSDLVAIDEDGTVLSFGAREDGTFDPPSASSSPVRTVRTSRGGHVPATEKPALRRMGCDPQGCVSGAGEWARVSSGERDLAGEDVVCAAPGQCLSVDSGWSDAGTSLVGISDRREGSVRWQEETDGAIDLGLFGAACPGYEPCFVVGTQNHGGGDRTWALQWNGSQALWKATPHPSGSKSSELRGVSCPSASACVAVGSHVTEAGERATLAVSWNGSAWSLMSTPATGTIPLAGGGSIEADATRLTGVSCPTTSWCAAVGAYLEAETGERKGLALRWNGSSWSALAAPAGEAPGALAGVSCASDEACLAVGALGTGPERDAWAIAWNGSAWVDAEAPSSSDAAWLNSVSCVSSSACVAAGATREPGQGAEPLVLARSGGSWSAQAIEAPAGARAVELRGVSCQQGEALGCLATGRVAYAPDARAEVRYEATNGSWSLGEAAHGGDELTAVSCPPGSSCVAIAETTTPEVEGALPHAWTLSSGRWSATTIESYVEGPRLTDVSCSGLEGCMAVGGAEEAPLAAPGWSGQWTVEPLSAPATPATLNGVSCTSIFECTVVGTYESGGRTLPMVNLWYGWLWMAGWMPTPSGTPVETVAQDVACSYAWTCVAVGHSKASEESQPAAMAQVSSGGGFTWSLQSIPLPEGTVASELKAVSCSSATACTAVGSYRKATGGDRPLVLRYNGSTWSLQGASVPGGSDWAHLKAISCYGSEGCVAVGAHGEGEAEEPLALSWDGEGWSEEGLPATPQGATARLGSVSCRAPGACLAVGATEHGGGHSVPLALGR